LRFLNRTPTSLVNRWEQRRTLEPLESSFRHREESPDHRGGAVNARVTLGGIGPQPEGREG